MGDRARRRSIAARSRAGAGPSLVRTLRDPRADAPKLPTGRVVGNYELVRELGRGGMGVVYEARDLVLGRTVALKMLLSRDADDVDLARFRAEASAVAGLRHPGIVGIHEIGDDDGRPFLSLEYIAGGGLDERIDDKPLPPAESAELLYRIAEAVEYAHAHGVIHRDLKPANVLLEKAAGAVPTPRITDFGLARKTDQARRTHAGEVLGTPAYMSPEQAEGRDVGPAADVWALGAILYECLTGRPPFVGASVVATLEMVRKHEPVRPRFLDPNVPADLETICLKCLAKDPARRYASAGELAADLGRFRNGEPILARPVGLVERAWKWCRRNPALAVLFACPLAAVLVGATASPWLLWQVREMQARMSARAAHDYEARRLGALVTDTRDRLASAKAGLEATDPDAVQQAAVAARSAADLISAADAAAAPELARLQAEAEQVATLASGRMRLLLGADAARGRLRAFLRLRDDAFFHLHRDLIAEADDSRLFACLDAARRAAEESPDATCLTGPDLKAFESARCELLVIQAEANARLGGDGLREALRLLEEASRLGGVRRGLLLRKARYLDMLDNPGAAAAARKKAESEKESGPLDLFVAALEEWHRGDMKAAKTLLDRVVVSQPGWFWPRLLRAVALERSGQRVEARVELDACVPLRKDFAWPYLLRAMLHLRAGEPDAAAKDLDVAEHLRLDRAERYVLHLERGIVQLERKDKPKPEEAESEFAKAARLWPSRFHAHANMARTHQVRGDHAKAVAAMDRAVFLAPDEPALYRTRSRLHAEAGSHADALADIEKTLALESGRPQAGDLAEKARLLYLGKRYADALPPCRSVLRLTPDDPAALRLHAELLLELSRHEEAVKAFTAYLRVGKADAEVYRRRARARAGAGDLHGVVEDYTLALEIRRETSLLPARGWAYLVLGAGKPALADFRAAIKAGYRDEAEALVGVGLAHLELSQPREALEALEAARKKNPATPRLLYQAARGYARLAELGSPRESEAMCGVSAGLLAAAVEATPTADRAAFWQKQPARDAAFRRVARLPEFVRLSHRYGATPPPR